MTDIHIPPAALEAGARAIREFYSDEPVAVCDGVAYKAARAAFVAMVKAWPGMKKALRITDIHDWTTLPPVDVPDGLILPLPTEKPDDKA